MLAANGPLSALAGPQEEALRTATPIKHLVIIFGENESFDHYFGTYPHATNPPGEPAFTAKRDTPAVNGFTAELLNNNPNLNPANGTGATNPFRLDRSQAHTSSQNHAYGPEQAAFDDGKMDLFPLNTGAAGTGGTGVFNTKGLVMGYYDGNTVTALWNYAQHFAMSDNSYSSTFGPSSPGAINLISGQTNGAVGHAPSNGSSTNTINNIVADGQGGFTMYGDSDPFGDVCSSTTSATTEMTGKNIGDLLNARNISWGWFEGGFDLTATNPNGTTGCNRSSTSAVVGSNVKDYVPHHQPFQYYASTRNVSHTRPTSVAAIGTSFDGGANHQYDTNDFIAAVQAGNLPAVSFLKAPAIQDAHPSNSDPLDEQVFVVNMINMLQKSPEWKSTAVIIAYDDSDGWYDHAHMVINPSHSAQDDFTAAQNCTPLPGTHGALSTPLPGLNGQPVQGRCGYGPRQPLLVISPFAKRNFVDHTLTDQSSILRFVEDNWLNGERIGQGSFDAIAGKIDSMFDFDHKSDRKLFLDPNLGTVVNSDHDDHDHDHDRADRDHGGSRI
ncbi:alkaline phosphatase family protein [Bradyrhizobium sp. ARR65]|uniref:phospholipase C n=1 Tax=Bradyrhizobium sp. ARR65 TaxID=1040989 RepID=UPI001FD9FC0A|nr:alkaline phosphatase family protein [Bradyrhizobium sp. ARR65]